MRAPQPNRLLRTEAPACPRVAFVRYSRRVITLPTGGLFPSTRIVLSLGTIRSAVRCKRCGTVLRRRRPIPRRVVRSSRLRKRRVVHVQPTRMLVARTLMRHSRLLVEPVHPVMKTGVDLCWHLHATATVTAVALRMHERCHEAQRPHGEEKSFDDLHSSSPMFELSFGRNEASISRSNWSCDDLAGNNTCFQSGFHNESREWHAHPARATFPCYSGQVHHPVLELSHLYVTPGACVHRRPVALPVLCPSFCDTGGWRGASVVFAKPAVRLSMPVTSTPAFWSVDRNTSTRT